MKLNRTVILPTDDSRLADELLDSLIFREDILVLLIFGDGPKIEKLVQNADMRAMAVVSGVERKVCWIRSGWQNLPTLMKLSGTAPQFNPASLATIVAASVSLGNKIADVIMNDETIDFVRIEHSFVKAGL